MVLHLSIPPETEARLREQASAEGKDPATLAMEALQQRLETSNGPSTRPTSDQRVAAWNRFVANMRQWGQNLPPGHLIDDSRESIYQRPPA